MDFAQQLKSQLNILDVISPYVRLKKVGTRYVGLCPFHNEKTPSFNVNAGHGFFKCFGCGVGGDLIRFIEMKEGLSFYEALQLLSERFGIPMPKRRSDSESPGLRSALMRAHEIAIKYYREALYSGEGKPALEYAHKRGLHDPTLERFEIGYAPRQGGLQRLLEREGLTPEQMELSGLILKAEDGRMFERFRGRLMFPIHTEMGKPIAFGGRALQPDQEPKYLNSPKTEIYDKSRVLYNFHRAREGMRKHNRAVLVEGYMDAIAVYSAGVLEAVAPCGTALTPEQSANLRRMADSIVINFDPDQAGLNAAERSLTLLLDAGLRVKVLHLPGGLDPDEYISESGADAYAQRLDQAPSYFHWLTDVARKRYDFRNPEEKVEAVKFLVAAVQKMPGTMERSLIATEMANSLGIEPRLLMQRVRVGNAPEKKTSKPASPHLPASEMVLLRLFVHDAETRSNFLPVLAMSPVFAHLRGQTLFQAMHNWQQQDAQDWSAFLTSLETPWRVLIEEVMMEGLPADSEGSGTGQAIACIQALEREAQDQERRQLRDEIKAAEQNGDMNRALELMSRLKQMESTGRLNRPR